MVIGLLATLPAAGLAEPSAYISKSKRATSSRSSTTQVPVHATKGVVKFVDANKLVITRSPKYGREMSFVLNPSTERVGNVNVGSTVAVRYRTEAQQRIATAITVEHAKKPPSAPSSHQ
jgi:hypothetical protein